MQEATVSAGDASDGGQRNTQVTVALISAGATVVTAVLGFMVATRDWDHSSTGQASVAAKPALSDEAKPALSDEAKLLLDDKAEDCPNDAPDTPENNSVTITSPPPGTEVREIAPKHAEVPLRGSFDGRAGDSLYVFSYHPSVCMYYFNPPHVVSTTNGPWEWNPVLWDSLGEKVALIAAVADRETDALLQELIRHGGDDAHVRRLPDRLQTARISVHVRPPG